MRLFFHTPFLTKNMIRSNIRIHPHVIRINYPKEIHIPGWYPFSALPGFIMISGYKVIDLCITGVRTFCQVTKTYTEPYS